MFPGNVIVVGAGPVGCTAALLLADRGIPVTLIERYPQPHPLPRAVHLDDEVTRTLHRLGVSDAFLAGSRPGGGLRLLDARHRVMAEFGRDVDATGNGFPGANMFHQPDLEALLLDRVDGHPLVDLHRGVEACAIDGVDGPVGGPPVRVHTRRVVDEAAETFTGSLVLGCDGANSTVRRLIGVGMQDLLLPSAGWSSICVPEHRSIPGTASSRSATRPAPPRSCTSPATGTGGSSNCMTARTKPT
jgi:3-(3-hydroxy-phenyl)propionate hydroxylase